MPRTRRSGWATLAATLLALCHTALAQSPDPAGEQRSRVEAAFLRNFARYVTWPASAFAGERAPWTVCVLGDDYFGDALERTFEGRTEQGRAFAVLHDPTAERLPGCQIVYVGHASVGRRRAVLESLRRLPVLTVGGASDFLHEGGMIRLSAGERIEMGINLDEARRASLVIPAKMLEVARVVIDNGVERRWR
jgi:hypothetical protein